MMEDGEHVGIVEHIFFGDKLINTKFLDLLTFDNSFLDLEGDSLEDSPRSFARQRATDYQSYQVKHCHVCFYSPYFLSKHHFCCTAQQSCHQEVEMPAIQCQSSEPMSMHAGLQRKHRKSCGVKLSGPVCAIRRAFHIVDQDCTCGKKCFQEALRKWDIDTVVGIIKYCQSEVYGKQYDEKYSIMREKVEGGLGKSFS